MLSKEEKIEIIQSQAQKHNITAYEFGENTPISKMGAHNILTGESKNPKNNSLNIMLEYLEQKISGEIKGPLKLVLEEPQETYNPSSELETILFKTILKKLQPKLDAIEKRLLLLENKK